MNIFVVFGVSLFMFMGGYLLGSMNKRERELHWRITAQAAIATLSQVEDDRTGAVEDVIADLLDALQ